jgi:large subunit ribosomal protein L27
MAHKKAAGSTQNGRDSNPKRRGVKRFGGQTVLAGEILIRQKGFWYRPGTNVHVGKDWTIHADVDGVVTFSEKRITKFNGKRQRETIVSVKPL